MARKFTLFPKVRRLQDEIQNLEKRLNDSWDLKGQTLLDLINSNTSGDKVTQKTAMKFTGVLAAVSLRSQLLASFPKMIYEVTNKGRQPIYNDLYTLLAYKPNPYMNAFTFWELVNMHLDLWGNAYVYITRYNGEVSSLMPIDPEEVEVRANGKLIYKVTRPGDKVINGEHSPDKFLHFKDISYDGIIGQSRISLARNAISLGISAESFGKQFYDKGGHSKGIIETEATLGDESYRNFKKRWDENANFGTPLLDAGKKYKQLTIPMDDAQFVATREFQLQDTARIFNVPPHLLADLSRATFSNVENSDIQWVKYGLRPMVKRYENELEYKLLGNDLGKINIRFNLDGMLRGDTATRSAYYATMKVNKIMTTNEIRALENMNPIEGGDILENPATSTNNGTQSN